LPPASSASVWSSRSVRASRCSARSKTSGFPSGREIEIFAREYDVGNHIVFLQDYDMAVATHLVSGCDVWINLPRPPLEASGTSGMKAALNGALNLSILDGWWMEAYDGTNGWGIDGSEPADPELEDERDAAAFYDLAEKEVIPLFFDRDEHGVPRGWVQRMKASLRTVGSQFTATRMVRDYLAGPYRTD